MAEWQPIETAPKDGRFILARVGQNPRMSRLAGRWFVVRHAGFVDTYDMGWDLYPGYGGVSDDMLDGWCPLPFDRETIALLTGAGQEVG